MAAKGTEIVTRLRPSGVPGRHGARPPEDPVDIANCHLLPRTSSESTDRSDTVVVGLTLVAPGGTDLVATDRIRWRDDIYEIDGMPGNFEKGGRSRAVIAALKKVTG